MNDNSLNSALVEAVKALGGSKQVGSQLWPEKSPDAAQRQLLDCLNEDRPAHLTPEQTLLILRLARAKGHHAAFAFLAETLGYAPPVPVDPRDEAAELQRQFIAATDKMAAMMARMQELQAPANTRTTALRAA